VASKRSDRHKKRKKSRRGPAPTVTRSMRVGPLEVFRQGAYVGMHVDTDHPDHQEFQEAQIATVERIPDRVLELREKIAETAAPFHAFDVVFAIWSMYSRARPGTLRPLMKDGSPCAAEYDAHVLLERPDAGPVRDPTAEEVRAGADPTAFATLVTEIVRWLPLWFIHRQHEPDAGDLDPWLELRSRLYTHRISVRSFAYEEQERETLHALFDDFAECLRDLAGFDADQALRLTHAVAEPPWRARRSARAARAKPRPA
jgi:hypothetical protein